MLITDNYKFYIQVIHLVFGHSIDFAQTKQSWQATGVGRVFTNVIQGRSDPDLISTTYVERLNLTMRSGIRRMTWLTNAFSQEPASPTCDGHPLLRSLQFLPNPQHAAGDAHHRSRNDGPRVDNRGTVGDHRGIGVSGVNFRSVGSRHARNESDDAAGRPGASVCDVRQADAAAGEGV